MDLYYVHPHFLYTNYNHIHFVYSSFNSIFKQITKVDETYTFDDGRWLIAISMAPGIIIGMVSALSVEITGLPELVGAYNGVGGLAAALEGIGLYLDPHAKDFVRGGEE